MSESKLPSGKPSRIRKSPTLGAFFAAMAKVQAEVEDPFKASENSHFRSYYAALARTIKNNRGIAAKFGICMMQFPYTEGNDAGSIILIGHESGEWLEAEVALPMQKRTCQGGGSAVSYSRRYQVQGVLNIAPTSEQVKAAPEPLPVEPERLDDFDPGDDDGETAEGRGKDSDMNRLIAEMEKAADKEALESLDDKLRSFCQAHPRHREQMSDHYKKRLKNFAAAAKAMEVAS